MTHAVYSFEILHFEFKIRGRVSFDDFTVRKALPGRYVYKTVGVQWIFDADHDDGELALIHLVHNKRLDTKRLIEYLLYCDFDLDEKNAVTKPKDRYRIEFDGDRVEFDTVKGWHTLFKMTDPITRQDYVWGVLPGGQAGLKKYCYWTKKTLVTLPRHFFPRKMQDFGEEACEKCFINKKSVIFYPCGCFQFCSACSLKMRDCPTCKERIETREVEGYSWICRKCGTREKLNHWDIYGNVVLCDDCATDKDERRKLVYQ